jgi:hypothetical protein
LPHKKEALKKPLFYYTDYFSFRHKLIILYFVYLLTDVTHGTVLHAAETQPSPKELDFQAAGWHLTKSIA